MADSDAPVKIKLQATFDAYEAWALARLTDRTGWKNHDLCRTIVREWLHLKREELRKEYSVSHDAWEREKGGNVLPIAKGRKSPQEGA